MADGTDEDGARAARMDEWVAWDATERTAPRGIALFVSLLGGSYPETCAQRTVEDGGSPLL
jgi:hypothetical protein